MRQTLEMALEALEESHPEAYRHTITAIKEALAQPEQEPVAWIEHHKAGDNLVWDEPSKGTPLYTTPPQRTWVGLNAGEVYYLYDSDYKVFHQRIEAKLKEKNT